MSKKYIVVASVALVGLISTACGTQSVANSTTQTSSGNATSNNAAAKTSQTSQPITVGYVNWDEDVAASYLWKYLLEQKGYQVNMDLLSPGAVWEGLYKGDLDVFFDSWMPYTDKNYEQKYGSQLTTINQWYGGVTKEGFAVPDYMHVKTMADLRKAASQVNGEIVGIEAGSSEMGLAKKALNVYNLPYHVASSSTPAMLSALKKAYSAKKPIVVTLWSPHWAFTKYHLHYISDPQGVFGKPGHIETVVNKAWAQANTKPTSWFKNFHLSQTQLGSLETDIAQDSQDPSAGVKKWVSDNQSVVNQWLS